MSDYIALLVKAARDVKVAKAQNPRAVQTVEQRQVEARQQPGVQDQTSRTASTEATGFVSKIPGGKTTLYGVGLLLVGTVIYKKAFA